MTEPLLIIENIHKEFISPGGEEKLSVLQDVSLSVDKGEIVGVLGPSGCGKTTLLNLVAGFDVPLKGRITFNGKEVTGPSASRGVVFQESALFPWLTVRENVGFGLQIRKDEKEAREKTVQQFIDIVGLKGFEDYYPDQLSGGMQQRTALARVLVMQPEALLMDEPFAALDAQTRMQMQQLLLSLSRQFHPAIFFITHDIEEALFLADRIFILTPRPGQVSREVHAPFSGCNALSLYRDKEFMELKGEILENMGLNLTPDPKDSP